MGSAVAQKKCGVFVVSLQETELRGSGAVLQGPQGLKALLGLPSEQHLLVVSY